MVVNDAKEREPRSKNIVIRGIKPLENDQQDKDAVNKFFEAVSEEKVTVKKVQRLFKAKNDMRNKSEPTSSILVCFDNRDEQQKALKAARQHSNPSYEGVFAHEDRTKAQLLEYSTCAKQAKIKNDELEKEELLDKPFRWVVRGNRIRCIDAVKSRADKQSVYVSSNELNQAIAARANKERLQAAVKSGSVNNTRQSTSQNITKVNRQ